MSSRESLVKYGTWSVPGMAGTVGRVPVLIKIRSADSRSAPTVTS